MGSSGGGAAALPKLFAARMINKAARELVFGVEREQQRQPRRILRIDVLFPAAMPPYPAQALVVPAVGAQHDGWRVMQEAAEGPLAEILVFARIEDELVPEVVGDLGRHRDELGAAAQISQEELAQAARDQRTVLAIETGMVSLQPLEQSCGPAVAADEFLAAIFQPASIQQPRKRAQPDDR